MQTFSKIPQECNNGKNIMLYDHIVVSGVLVTFEKERTDIVIKIKKLLWSILYYKDVFFIWIIMNIFRVNPSQMFIITNKDRDLFIKATASPYEPYKR